MVNQDQSRRRRALCAMGISAVMFAVMAAATKWATRPLMEAAAIPGSEVALIRFAIGVFVLLILGKLAGTNLLGNDRKALFWRGISGGVASLFFFVGIQLSTLTNASLLNSASVVWSSLIAIFVLGETLSITSGAAIFMALFGAYLVINPHLDHLLIGDLISLGSGVAAGTAIVQVRRLRQTEASLPVFFYFNLIGFPLALVLIFATHTRLVAPTLLQWGVLTLMGHASVAAQLLMTYGYKELKTAQGSLIILANVIFAALFSHLFFHEDFNWNTLLGGALIIGSAVTQALKRDAKGDS